MNVQRDNVQRDNVDYPRERDAAVERGAGRRHDDAGAHAGSFYPGGGRPHNISETALNEVARRMVMRCEWIRAGSASPLVFSHVTALALMGIELPMQRRFGMDEAHVVVPSRNETHRRKGVKYHVWRGPLDTVAIGGTGLECASPLPAWAQMSDTLSLGELVVLGDSIMRGDRGIYRCNRSDFGDFLLTELRFRGKAKCRRALRFMAEGVDSSWETRLRLALLQHGLPFPEVNHAVYDRLLDHDLRIDLAYPEHKVALEYQGDHHRTSRAQYRFDQTKRRHLQDMGWRVITVTSDDLRDDASRLDLSRSVARSMHARMPMRLRPKYRALCEA